MLVRLMVERQWKHHSLAQEAKKLMVEIRVGWSRVHLSIIQNVRGSVKKVVGHQIKRSSQNAYKPVEKSPDFQCFTIMTAVRNLADLDVRCL